MSRLPGLHPNIVARRSRMRRAALTVVGASLILVACGTDSGSEVDEDRQFANDPAPTRMATEIPTPSATPPVRDDPPRTIQATPADLLRTRGAPSTLYTVSDNRLYVLTPGNEPALAEVDLPPDLLVAGTAASPTGDRVGVVMTSAADASVQVSFFDASGEMIGGPYAVAPMGTPAASAVASPVATPAATPVGADTGRVVPVSWAPQGNGILFIDDNALVYVDVERGAETIPTAGIQGALLDAAASPTGGQILVHVAADDGSHRAYLIQRDTGELDELWAMRTEPGIGLAELSWLPTGNGIVFVRGELVDGVVMRGQLFSYRFRDDTPRLVATSGQGGPSASIRNVAISADGRSVAYEVAIFDVDHWSMHSMWVRSLKHEGQGLQLPVDSGHTVNDLAWSGEGLVWTYTARYGPEGNFLGLIAPDGGTRDTVAIIAPEPSPVASPVTAATPVASPGATPVASPGASPAG